MTAPLINLFLEGEAALQDEIAAEKLSALATGVLESLNENKVTLSLIITDDETIHGINRDYRKKDRPTDVISFAYREEPFPGEEEEIEELGDVYISVDTAARQAEEYGVSLYDEMKRLIIHGILHLVGYDHEISPEEEERMQAKEEELFSRL